MVSFNSRLEESSNRLNHSINQPKVGISLITWIVYALFFLAVFERVGLAIAPIVAIPIALTGWFWGLWGAVIAAALGLGFNTGLVAILRPSESMFSSMQVDDWVGFMIAAVLGIGFGYLRDMRQSLKQQQAQLLDQDKHDSLTGLLNRYSITERLERALIWAEQDATLIATLFIDLDRFKLINDTLGHKMGDLILQRVAGRLRSQIRDNDMLARISGDEFVLVLTGFEKTYSAVTVAQKVLRSLEEPFTTPEGSLSVRASIGISLYPQHGQKAETLLAYAEQAMKKVKTQGKNNFKFVTSEIDEELEEQFHLEQALEQAIKRNAFMLHYQPQLNFGDGKLLGFEALLRWVDKDLGNMMPHRFIPIAEETGLIVPIGNWILNEACRQVKQWQDAGLPKVTVAINVSAFQFNHSDFVDSVKLALERNRLDPSYIEIELTESVLIRDIDKAVSALEALQKLGVHIAIDDFGIGYSSLSYLHNLPIDVLKIDRSFIAAISDDSSTSDDSIVRAIISMAHSLNKKVVAEGVETITQHQKLQALGCDRAQGYYFYKPLSPKRATELLADPRYQLSAEG